MLVIGRKELQRVFMFMPDGGVIEVFPCRCENGKTRLGITAPPSVVIVREEIATPEQLARAGVRKEAS